MCVHVCVHVCMHVCVHVQLSFASWLQRTAIARSKKALNPLICLSVLVLLELHACSVTLPINNSKFASSAAFNSLAESSGAARPCSMARSTSCIAVEREMLCCAADFVSHGVCVFERGGVGEREETNQCFLAFSLVFGSHGVHAQRNMFSFCPDLQETLP